MIGKLLLAGRAGGLVVAGPAVAAAVIYPPIIFFVRPPAFRFDPRQSDILQYFQA